MSDYGAWIERYQAAHPKLLGLCAEATLEMQTAFPELRRVRGHVDINERKPWSHWWLVTPSGEIVDPTARQFPVILEYQPWDEARSEPTGKCLNCGDYTFNGAYLCGEVCEVENQRAFDSARANSHALRFFAEML